MPLTAFRAFALAAFVAAVVTYAGAARAQRTTTVSTRSAYEQETIEGALEKIGGVPELEPEGKIVEGIDVVTLEVIERRDPAPRFLNIFHVTTQTDVVRREVLLRIGEPYRQYRVDETVRSLRIFQQLSLVLAQPVRGSAPDRVRVLVVTKDVWSLRTQFDLKVGGGGLDLLRFEPTERNIGGTLNSVVTRLELLPETLTLGGAYFAPRLGGRRLYSITDVNLVFSRASGEPEGSFGRIGVSTPQLSADTPFVWGFGVVWADVFVRRYVGARLATFDAESTQEIEAIPDLFHARSMTQTLALVRSFGRADKLDLAFGAELSVREFIGLDRSRYDAAIVEEYRMKRVPTSDNRVAPWVQVRTYESRFVRLHDLDVLALEEDYRVGYDTWLRAYPVTRALGSTRDFLGLSAAFQYVVPIKDGLLRATTEAITELAKDEVPTLAVGAGVQLASPRFPLGRLIVDGVGIARPRNYLNHRSSIGGEGRLRGYPSAAFLGENLVAYNVELRTKPIDIFSLQLGGALFFDVGDAFDGSNFRPKSSAGVGLRGLIPQLDRKVMRLDVAFPMVRGSGVGAVGFYISFEQAFPAGATSPPGVGPAQAILNPAGMALQ